MPTNLYYTDDDLVRIRSVRYDAGKYYDRESGKEILTVDKFDEVLKAHYDDPAFGLLGRDKFWAKIYEKYAGIKKTDVVNFLERLENRQIFTRPNKPNMVKSIIITKPLSYFQVDLIDMKQYKNINQGHAWILTCLDLCTKYAWAYPIKTKQPSDVIARMNDIWANIDRKGSRKPSTIQTDNGNEFKGSFDTWVREKKVKHIRSASYSPWTQGAVERFNRTLKGKLFKFFENENTKFFLDVLPLIVKGYNSTVHSAHKRKPVDIFSEVDDEVVAKLKERDNSTFLQDVLTVGDKVRVLKHIEQKVEVRPNVFEKKIKAQWTETLFTIAEVRKIKDKRYIYKLAGRPDKFRPHQLQKVDDLTLLKQTKERKDYSEISGVGQFNVQEHARQMGQEHKRELLEEKKVEPIAARLRDRAHDSSSSAEMVSTEPENSDASVTMHSTSEEDRKHIEEKIVVNSDGVVVEETGDEDQIVECKFLVKKLHERKKINNVWHYLVEWRNYPDRADFTWQKRIDLLDDTPGIVRAYERDHPIRRKRKKIS